MAREPVYSDEQLLEILALGSDGDEALAREVCKLAARDGVAPAVAAQGLARACSGDLARAKLERLSGRLARSTCR